MVPLSLQYLPISTLLIIAKILPFKTPFKRLFSKEENEILEKNQHNLHKKEEFLKGIDLSPKI